MMQQTQRGQGLNRPGLVVRAKHDLRELLEQGFEVAVVKDATAGPKHPEWGYGYTAALIGVPAFMFLLMRNPGKR